VTGEQGGGGAGFSLERADQLQTDDNVDNREEFGTATGGTDNFVTCNDLHAPAETNLQGGQSL
jgi:hypothetical protein